jgi:hypothetical protein
VELPAKVIAEGGSPLCDCIMLDISDSGAKLRIDDPERLPEDFTIALAPRGPYRRCHIVWRTDSQVGVEFNRCHQEPAQSVVPDHRGRPGFAATAPLRQSAGAEL